MIGDDARRAVDEGADGVVVSNHGGRQLDCVYPTLRALPEVVAAVNGQCEVLLDGGIRRGTDIVKACAWARARSSSAARMRTASAAGGGAGVARAIEILRADIVRTHEAPRLPVSRAARRVLRYVSCRVAWRDARSQGLRDEDVAPTDAVARRYSAVAQ